jgi:hypothetical protein
MPKVSKDTARFDDHGVVAEWVQEVEGYEISFLTFRESVDATPLLAGLPDDMCQCPHWGYMLEGRVTFRFADRVEEFGPGDAFYLPPGHVPTAEAGTSYVQFSPAHEVKATNEAVLANLQKMQPA